MRLSSLLAARAPERETVVTFRLSLPPAWSPIGAGGRARVSTIPPDASGEKLFFGSKTFPMLRMHRVFTGMLGFAHRDSR